MIKAYDITINFISAIMITAAAIGLVLCSIGIIREHQYCALCVLLLLSACVLLIANYKKGISRKCASIKNYLSKISSDESLDHKNKYYDPAPNLFAEHYFDEDALSADRAAKIHVDRRQYYSEPYENEEQGQFSAYEEALYHSGWIKSQPFFAEYDTTPPDNSSTEMKTFSSSSKARVDTTIRGMQDKNDSKMQITDGRVEAVKPLSEEQGKGRA